ncbi:hypothetical protein B0H13DRAFT_2111020, partial [Mycena leptocephala]
RYRLEYLTNLQPFYSSPRAALRQLPEVAKALIHAFLDSFGGPGTGTEVRKEFKHLGIKEELCSIRATKAHQQTADKAFEGFWERLTQHIELPLRRAMHPPDNINFSILKPKPWGETKELDPMQKALKYAQTFHQVGLEARRLSNSQISSKMMEDTQAAMRHLESTSTEEIQKEADAGDTTAALDYAVRIRCNIGVKPSRSLHHYYLLKVIQSEATTKEQKSQAHGLLIDWFMAAHDAHAYPLFSVILAGDASPAVLWFGFHLLKPQAEKVPALNAQYKALWLALEKRHQEISKEQSKAEKKREKASNRYICAAPNCYIQASKGGGKGSTCSWPRPTGEVLTIPIAGPDGQPMMLSSSTMTPEMLKMLQAMSLGEKNPDGADKTLTK